MIRDVIVSDLHLGAPNSLLSNVTDHGVTGGTPSPVLAALGEALTSLTAEQAEKPRLVPGGDIFELALTPTSCAFDTFVDFVQVMFTDPVFSSDVHYVAGNHDHHLWELARQHQYTEYIEEADRGAPLRNDWHVTRLLPGALYDMLQSEAAIEAVVDRALDIVMARHKPTWRRRIGTWLLRTGAKLVVHEGLHLERHQPTRPLSKDAERGMREYLRVAVAAQLAEEIDDPARPLTFVFGHAHKPFAVQADVEGVDRPVDVFNTGGWVIDTVQPSPLQGASLVLTDRHGHVAALEVYQQAEGHDLTVTSLSPDAAELVSELERRIDADRPLWDALESTIADEIVQRRRQLAERVTVDTRRVEGVEPMIAPRAETGGR